ncbi:acyltransferase family protein [Nocardia sp. NPDC004722]
MTAPASAVAHGAPASIGRPRLPTLTGARWWAALAVFVLHALVLLPAYPFQKSELFRRIHQDFLPMQLGAAGVTFFFVLSGFIIYWSFRPGSSAWAFYRKRVLKIYPTHLVAALTFIVVAAVPVGRIVLWLPNLLLIHTWWPKWTTVGGLNIPSWSLASEMLFYLSFPLAAPVVQRIPPRRLLAWIVGLGLLVLALHLVYFLGFDGPRGTANAFAARLVPGDTSPTAELHATPQWFAQPDIPVVRSYWFSYDFPLSRLPEFYVGVLAARAVLEGQWRSTRLLPVTVAVFVAYVASWVVPIDFKMSALEVLPMAALIATLATRDMRGLGGFNASPTMVWFGEVSYAFYLIQFPIMVLVTRYVIAGRRFGFFGWLGCAALCFMLALAASTAVYHGIDKPLMRRFVARI